MVGRDFKPDPWSVVNGLSAISTNFWEFRDCHHLHPILQIQLLYSYVLGYPCDICVNISAVYELGIYWTSLTATSKKSLPLLVIASMKYCWLYKEQLHWKARAIFMACRHLSNSNRGDCVDCVFVEHIRAIRRGYLTWENTSDTLAYRQVYETFSR